MFLFAFSYIPSNYILIFPTLSIHCQGKSFCLKNVMSVSSICHILLLVILYRDEIDMSFSLEDWFDKHSSP